MRTRTPNTSILFLASVLAALSGVSQAQAVNVIVNGGFEAAGGSFNNWTVLNQVGGSGNWFVQAGLVSPMSGFPVPAAPGPTHAAMTDQGGPGSHVLYQDVVVPAGVTNATLSYMLFRGNRGGPYTVGNPLDYTINPTQEARVDFITTAANPFSILPADVLLNVWQIAAADPNVDPNYIAYSFNVTAFMAAHGGQTVRLRFAECDNQGFFQIGLDNVALNITSGPTGGGGGTGEGSFVGMDPPPGNHPSGTEGGFSQTTNHLMAPTAGLPVLAGPFLDSLGAGNMLAPQGLVASPPSSVSLRVCNVSAESKSQATVPHLLIYGGEEHTLAWSIAVVGLLALGVALGLAKMLPHGAGGCSQ